MIKMGRRESICFTMRVNDNCVAANMTVAKFNLKTVKVNLITSVHFCRY